MQSKDLVKLTIMLLRKYGVKIRRRLSQHFVVNDALINELMMHAMDLRPEYVVEIGTGLGFLTTHLCDAFKNVVTIELDRRLARAALELLRGKSNVNIVVGEGINFLINALRSVDVVVSNVPYGITGPLIMSVIKSNCRAAVLTIQDEVALRLKASPGSREYSRLTVMVNTFMDVELGGKYLPEDFYPPPKVSSRVVVLRRVRRWSYDWEVYEGIVKCLFNQRRRLAKKVLSRCLNELRIYGDIYDLINLVGDRRVYQLPVNTLIEVFRKLAPFPS